MEKTITRIARGFPAGLTLLWLVVAAAAGCGGRNGSDAASSDRATMTDAGAPTSDAPANPDLAVPDAAPNDDRPTTGVDATPDTSPPDALTTDTQLDAPGAARDALPVRGDALSPVVAGDTVCYASGWCWSYPTPLGGVLSVWAGAAGDVWVVGEHGTTRHFDGQAWTNVPTPTTVNLEAVWGAAANAVWAVGEDVVLFWNGTRWTTVPAPAAATRPFGGDVIDGSSASDVWLASSARESVWHFDGNEWTAWSQQFTTREIWVDPAGAGYVLPDAPITTLARKGQADATFKRVDTGSYAGAPSGVWSPDPNDIWLVYFDGLAHFDGLAWSTKLALPLGLPFEQLQRVAGTDRTDVWFSEYNGDMLHWNGAGFERWPVSAMGLDRISVRSRDDVWAAGRGGTLVHFDGAAWRRLSSNESFGELAAISGVGPDEVWAVSINKDNEPQSTRYRAASGWETAPMPAGRVFRMRAIWGASPDDVWAVGVAVPPPPPAPTPAFAPFYHWQGSGWTRLTGFEGHSFIDVWGTATDDVWVVGSINLHWNGQAWTPLADAAAPTSGGAVSGTGRSDVWIASGNILHHLDATGWSRSQPTSQPILGVWARSPNDVFAWSRSEIHRFDGQAWRLIHSYLPNSSVALDRYSVHGSSTELWAATRDGALERWDGTTWTKDEQFAAGSDIVHVTARDVWLGAFGIGGGIMRKARSP